METQIGIVKRISADLSQPLQDMQCQILSQLEGKLKTATLMIEQLRSEKKANEYGQNGKQKGDDRDITAMMDGLRRMKASKKIKYVSKKKALYEVVHEIEKWQARYDPTWILIMQMSHRSIDKELHKEQTKAEREQIPIIVAAKGMRDAARAAQGENVVDRIPIWIDDLNLSPLQIPHSSVQHSLLHDEEEAILIDTVICNPAAHTGKTTQAVRNLARVLGEVEPATFSLLKCRGVIKITNEKCLASWGPSHSDFQFIFNIPPQHTNPQSLRTLLLSRASYPLDERLDLAKRLTSSILFVHTVRFVHKNIRPENIIIFQNQHSQIGAPFLAGFEQFRVEDGHTYRVGDDKWHQNLCINLSYSPVILLIDSLLDRHPTRQGTNPQSYYQMQHDIYSLGVVLLEIGLWTSFVLYDSEEESSLPTGNSLLETTDLMHYENILGGATQVKLKLENLAANKLPAQLGRRYTEIVLLCLRCLDQGTGVDGDGKGFGTDATDWTDEDGITIGVRYIENVLMKMQEFVM